MINRPNDLERKLGEAEMKRVFKEALQEWMDKKFLEFSKYSMQGLVVLAFGALIVFIMWSQGWHR